MAATKTVAKEGAEKLSKQMTKIVKSGKLDNVIATMDAGKDFAVRFKNGSTALIKKGDLSEFVCQVFNKGCFMAGTLVATKDGLKNIEEVKIGGISPMSRHEGNHKAFNDFIESKLDNIDINKDIKDLEKEIHTLQQKCKALMEEGLPMYSKDNERIDKIGDTMRKLEEISYGDKTIDLWERWFKK